jgi:hypothetical protein
MKPMKNNYPTKSRMYAVFALLIAVSCCFTAIAQSGNVGIGTNLPGSKLTINGSFAATYKTIDANTTLNGTDFYLAVNSTANRTITLPAAVAGAGNFLGRTYNIKNTGTFSVTITAAGLELISNQSGAGVSTIVLPEGYYCMLISKGTTTGTTWEAVVIPGGAIVPQYINCVGPISANPVVGVTSATPQVYTPWIPSTSNGLTLLVTGYIQLTPGYTYKLDCSLYGVLGSSATFMNFRWVDGSNTVLAGTNTARSNPSTFAANESSVTTISTIYTATSGNGSRVGVYLSTSSAGSFQVFGGHSYLTIVQLR